MDILTKPLYELEGFNKLINCISTAKSPVIAEGLVDTQKWHLLYGLMQKTGLQSMIIASSELKAKEIYDDLQFFLKDKIMLYPSQDIIFYSADVHSMDIVMRRSKIINSLLKGEKISVVLSVEALYSKLLKKDLFRDYIINLEVGDLIAPESLISKLVKIGYERRDIVESIGQFSSRGGIIDLFSVTDTNAIRIEFFDDEIDSIRMIDIVTQRSVERLQNVSIFPTRELVYSDETLSNAISNMELDFACKKAEFSKLGLLDEIESLESSILSDIDSFKNNGSIGAAAKYIEYFYDKDMSTTLLDYFPADTLIIYDEPLKVKSHAENVTYEFEESIKNHILKGYMLPKCADMVFSYAQILRFAAGHNQLLFMQMLQNARDFNVQETINFEVKNSEMFRGRLDLLTDELIKLKQSQYRVLVLSGTRSRAERLSRELFEKGTDSSFINDENINDVQVLPSQILIIRGSLSKGFIYNNIKFAVISDRGLFGEDKKRKRPKARERGKRIESFTDLKQGDYVVHSSYGIGIYRGIEKIVLNNISRDFIKISYDSESNVYVPVNQMDLIQKFIGGDGHAPKLNKLGTTEWSKAKAKVKKAVHELAKDLVVLYAKRQEAKGYVFSKDTVWQSEFEEMFPFDETADQLTAIEDVKADMESDKAMDRLICGDVGYGKTEVAIRAAFKSAQDGKQVAYLVPTTILAQQHYTNFKSRMESFPITVDLLSRFRTKGEQNKVVEGIKNGSVDIVIGTHRLLSKDIKFRDLGLIIVDEEQRFGVSHKEKLKLLRDNVDVLTLTATPIPRTLHMSMTGIRDMSILEEPPQERQPIQTYVMEYNTEFVRDAVHRELSRKGQIYYLHNRVQNITQTAAKLQAIIPEARIAYAHGQMSERELENIMSDFIEGEIDMLVCTTIIETGLDIPNVNTIIIQDADRMGLAQLYQLRGRVGRSNRVAYAYLMYKKDKVLKEIAEKRLQTIKEFTEFGSGFKIAMRDLEIRGAGNLLGVEQHGHMESVGYDMYCKLLEEAVSELKGETPKPEMDVTIDIQINAYIPDQYISNEETKLEIYKKISLIQSNSELNDVEEEIEDRFGDLPKSVQNLLLVASLKMTARTKKIISVSHKRGNIVATFDSTAAISTDTIAPLIQKYRGRLLYTAGEAPYLTYKVAAGDIADSLRELKGILEEI